MALKDVNHNKHFSNLIYEILFVDWTPGEQKEYRQNKNPPDFHLPLKAVIAVPYDNGKWDVFWSKHGKDHAEDYLRKDSNYRNINYFAINFTPCAQKCTPKFIRDSQDGGSPEIYAIWPFRISPKGIEREQVTAIYNLKNRVVLGNWNDFSSFVDAICALRKKSDLLCRDVRKAMKSKAFRQRDDCAESLMDTIKSEATIKSKERTLKDTMDNYVFESYPIVPID